MLRPHGRGGGLTRIEISPSGKSAELGLCDSTVFAAHEAVIDT
jgi:hypothetical protein